MSNNFDDLMQQANSAFAENRLDDCGRLCDQILAGLPDAVPALVMAGIVRYRESQSEESLPFFEKAVGVDPGCAPAFLWLSMALHKAGRRDEALLQARKAVSLNPGDPMAQHQLGQCLLELGNAEEAVGPLERAAAMAPNVPQPHLTFGLALKELGMMDPAVRELRRAIRLDPQSIEAMVALRQILISLQDRAGVGEISHSIVMRQPDSAQANLWMAESLLETNKGAEAAAYLSKAIELDPDGAEAHLLLGSLEQVSGRLSEAEQHFNRSIDLKPTQGSAYLALVSNRKITQADQPLVDKMRSLVSEADLPISARAELSYALGKAHENLEEYRSAMKYFDEANKLAYELKFGDKAFDRREAEVALQTTIERFDREFLTKNASVGSKDPTPIFVVGMIRSGTTLAEQILSAHPQVGAAGEQSFWLESSGAFSNRSKTVDPALLAKFADRYVGLLRSIAPGKDRVVDKMPMNYMIIGLLKVAFPNAKIIHIQRHPIDTCLSIYVTPIKTRLSWAHSKANIALNYKQYQMLMEHWRSILTPEDMLEVQYEDLVSDLETSARSMIQFCGLEWNEACLRPQDNERSVITPSVWQVRQPIYKTSVERWKRYQGMLGPIEALA